MTWLLLACLAVEVAIACLVGRTVALLARGRVHPPSRRR